MKVDYNTDNTIFRTKDKKLVLALLKNAKITGFKADLVNIGNHGYILVDKGLKQHQIKSLRYYISKHLNRNKPKQKIYEIPEIFRGHRGCLISGHDLSFK